MAHELTDQQALSLARKGGYKQFYMTRQHYEAGTCPFCLNNGLDPKVNEVEYNNDTWLVWQAPAALRPKRMQNGLLRHVMIVPIEHDTSIFALTTEQKLGLFDALEWAQKNFGINSGLFFSRLGSLAFNGGTEIHPSFQFKVPDRDMPDRKRLEEVFIKTEEDEAANWARYERFSALYEEGVTPEDFDRLVADKQITKEGLDYPKGE